METPSFCGKITKLHAFRISHDTYDSYSNQQKQEAQQFLKKIGEISKLAQKHPKNLYDTNFLQRNHEYIILAQNNEILGFLKLGFKKLYQYGKSAKVYELITPCLLDIFVLEQHRKSRHFKTLILLLELATGFPFAAFALDDPPREFLNLIKWKVTDQASKFVQQTDAIEAFGDCYKKMSQGARAKRCEMIDSSEPGGFICQGLKEFLGGKWCCQYDPFSSVDLAGESAEMAEYAYQEDVGEQVIEGGDEGQVNGQISQDEYNEFLLFRKQKQMGQMQCYAVNDKQKNVPMRRIDEQKMGMPVREVVRQPNRVRQQAEEFEYGNQAEVKQQEYVDLEKIKKQSYSPFQPLRSQQQLMPQFKADVTAYQPAYENTHHTHSHNFGNTLNTDDTYRRKNEFVTMDMVNTNSYPKRVPFTGKPMSQRNQSGRMW